MSENTFSIYAKVFDSSCKNWTKDKEYNLMFIKHIQAYCNDMLRARHWLFLRDVYEWLGLPITKESCIVGWIYDDNNIIGDNFVDISIQEEEDDSPNFVLDFNVDGEIISRLC